MTSKLTKLLEELHKIQSKASVQALATAPLARPLPSTAGNSLFGKTAELRATMEKIRAIEAATPSLARFPATAFPAGNLCDKKHLEQAQRHLASITDTAPRKAFASLDPKAPTKPAKVSAPATTATTYEWQTAPKPVLSREKFAALPNKEKSQFIGAGGKLTN
jgi:hypothetical protein